MEQIPMLAKNASLVIRELGKSDSNSCEPLRIGTNDQIVKQTIGARG